MIGWQIGTNDFAPVYGVYLPLDHTPNPPLTIFGDRVYLIALRLFGEKVIAETITIVTRESILGADPDLPFVIAENAQTGITGQPIVHGITGEMLTVKTRDSANGRNPQVPLLILAQGIGLRLDEAMFYIQIDEVVLLRPYSRQHYPTYGPTYASFHPVDNMLASYNIGYKNETPTKWAGDHEKLLYRRVKKCLYQEIK